jgi:uncharacterized protein YqhQ
MKQIGGQAVIEGVMMRRGDSISIAVRKPDDGIFIRRQKIRLASERWPVLKLPVLRGMVAFVEALVLGVKALSISASAAMEDEEEDLPEWQLGLTMALGLILGIGLFFFLPTVLAKLLAGGWTGLPLLLNLFEGGLRISIFVAYIYIISRLKDVQRVFQYHGAEHKVIFCHEAGHDLTVNNARDFSPLHPRCGTSFLLLVMAVSILLFSFFGWPVLWQRLLLRLSLLPLVAGLSYEVIRLAARYRFFCWLTSPGLWLQRLTTREPDDAQLEVAISALESVLLESE